MDWLTKIDWLLLLQVVLGAGVGSGIFSWWKDKQTRGREATYLALRIAVALESFEAACFERFSDIGLFDSSGGNLGGTWTKVPELERYPEDPDGWRSLDFKLADRALSFPGMISNSQGMINFTLDVASPIEASENCETECAELGMNAKGLATEIRKRYRLDIPDSAAAVHFQSHLAKIKKRD
ncbi:hypothetical protein [Hoeflea marina]|uniref:hypothetical protein n=1 Tax=Hoeflea marina TaxID=274592 RepID=UPI0011B5F257|nr:hypothetical protein [Hoeflea marina]